MSDIFISYGRKDQAKARMLADKLEARGWSVWWDPKIRSGEPFDRVIETALRDANCIIVLWSYDSVNSDWVRAEATKGLERRILISVLIEHNVELPLRFSQIQTEQLADWNGKETSTEFKKLIADVEAILGSRAGSREEVRVSGAPPAISRISGPGKTIAGIISAVFMALWLPASVIISDSSIHTPDALVWAVGVLLWLAGVFGVMFLFRLWFH